MTCGLGPRIYTGQTLTRRLYRKGALFRILPKHVADRHPAGATCSLASVVKGRGPSSDAPGAASLLESPSVKGNFHYFPVFGGRQETARKTGPATDRMKGS